MTNYFYRILFFTLLLTIYDLKASLQDRNDPSSLEQRQKFYKIIDFYEQRIKEDPTNVKLIVAVADVYYSLRDYEKAVIYYSRALKLDPSSVSIKKSLALSYLNDYDLIKSKELLDQLVIQNPSDTDILGGLGRIQALENHSKEAEDYYNKALSIDPNHLTTLFYLSELKIDLKEYKQAQKILESIIERDPQATWINQALKRAKLGPLFQEINKLEKYGDYQTAALLLKNQLKDDPSNIEIYLALSKTYTKMRAYNESINLLKLAKKRFPEEISLDIALGFTYLEKKDLARAEVNFENVIDKNSSQIEALAGLGKIAFLRGEKKQAEKYYNKALKLNPYNILVLSYLAEVKKDNKEFDQALKIYQTIYQIDESALWAKSIIDELKQAPLLKEINKKETLNEFVDVETLYEELLNQFPNNINNVIRFANYYKKQKRYDKAIAITEKAIQLFPKEIPLYESLAFSYLMNGELQKAKDTFQNILNIDPLNAESIAGLGYIEFLIGDVDNAKNFYNWALEIAPDNMTALSYLINLEFSEKDYSQAEKNLLKVQQIEPNATWAKQAYFQALYGKQFDEIKTLESLNEWNQALTAYQKLLNLNEESIDIYQGLARAYTRLNNPKKALEIYEAALQKIPYANELRVNMGLTYLGMKDYEKSKEILIKAYAIDSKNEEAIAGLGKLYALQGDLIAAEKYYQTALQINPNNILTLSYVAEFFMQQKEFDKAQETYKKILDLDKSALWAENAILEAKYAPILLEGEEKEKTQDYSEAINIYLSLIEKNPKNVDSFIKLGSLYIKQKRYDEAIVLYQKGLQINPRSTPLRLALAFAYLSKGDLIIAKNIFEMIKNENPKNAEVLAGIGKYYELTNSLTLAESYYNQALEIDPNNITSLIFKANLLSKLNEYEKASIIYKKILKLQPDASWVKTALLDAKNGKLIAEIKKNTDEKNYQKVEILYEQLLLQEPDVVDYYLRFGLFYNLIKQYEKAINIYKKGLVVDKNSAELYAALGLSYLSKKEYLSAKNAFVQAIEIDPLNPDGLAGLGFIAMIDKNYFNAEKLMLKALQVDSDRIAALSSYGELLMREKKYDQAVKIYEKMIKLRPQDAWIKFALDDAKNGPKLDEINALIEDAQYAAAIIIYDELLETAPDNPRYYVGLGQMYMRLKSYERSIDVNLKGLEKNPEDNELRVALGYAYFFNNDLMNARIQLTKAMEIDKKDPEAIAGLARVNFLEKDYTEAEELFIKALEIDPKNLSTLQFYSDLLMKQKRYCEAAEVYSKLAVLLPDAIWVQRAYQNAVDGPIIDIADDLAKKEEFELAANLYRQLIYLSPDDPSRYLALGQMYVNLQQYCRGICIFEQGLMVDPEAWFLWREIGFTYILLEDFSASQCIFTALIEIDSDDASSYAGLGRVQALNGTYCLAEEYYQKALSLSESNLTTLSFLSDLRQNEQYHISALEIYERIDEIVTSNSLPCETKPKWMRRGLNKTKNLSYPTLTVGGLYHEEDQWDFNDHRWAAEYLVYGGKVQLNYPVCDVLTLWGSVSDQIYALKDLINRSTIYSFDVQRYYLGTKIVYSPCFYLDLRAGITHYSPDRYGDFRMQHGLIAEPALVFTFHKPYEKATFGFSSGSDLIARDFSKNLSKVVPYYYLLGTYERRIIRRGWIGFEANAFWYCDYVNNNSQRVLGWFQWRPPYYSDNILIRYITKFQTFAKNIPDYYTYKPQFINQLQITLEKDWRVCFADTFYTSLSYSHGFQNTHTRYPQIIVVDPTVARPPFVWDNRQFDTVIGTLIYKYDRIQFTFTADYYRDTEKYTIWNVAGDLTWRF